MQQQQELCNMCANDSTGVGIGSWLSSSTCMSEALASCPVPSAFPRASCPHWGAFLHCTHAEVFRIVMCIHAWRLQHMHVS